MMLLLVTFEFRVLVAQKDDRLIQNPAYVTDPRTF